LGLISYLLNRLQGFNRNNNNRNNVSGGAKSKGVSSLPKEQK
jgi:hypothetical protein